MKETKKCGIVRQTNQRRIILEELKCVTSHPTAAAIYEMVKKRLPRVSLGTVYRNLELLADNGVIQKLDFGEPHKRFDGNPRPHYHISCSKCGRIDDVHIPLSNDLENLAADETCYDVDGHHVSFSGVCPACRASLSC